MTPRKVFWLILSAAALARVAFHMGATPVPRSELPLAAPDALMASPSVDACVPEVNDTVVLLTP